MIVLLALLMYQDFTVEVTYTDLLVISTPSVKIDRMVKGIILSSEIKEGTTTTIKKATALIEVSIDESVAFCDSASIVQVGSNYLIDSPGKHKVTIVVIKPKLAFKTVLVELGQGPNPPPDPIDPIIVPNDYGVGQVAYDNAPVDANGHVQFASFYKQAGEFLYGRPSIKIIADVAEPNSVFFWLSQQMDEYPCPSPEICAEWKTWRAKVSAAFVMSQGQRQYTREDWFAAFNEVVIALEVKHE